MHRRLPPLNAIRAFEAAGRLGSMTAAAAELAVTHGAVSRQVKLLEKALGVALFAGPRNKPRLTGEGRRLLPALSASFDLMDSAVRRISPRREVELTVSCPGAFLMCWVMPRLHRFQRAHPDIEVRMTATDAPVDFSRQRIDIALRLGRPPWPSGVTATPFLAERMGPVANSELLIRLAPRRVEDLRGATLVHSETRRDAWDAWLARAGGSNLDTTAGPVFEHCHAMLQAIAAGEGVGVVPQALIADALAAQRLIAPFGFVDSGLSYAALLPAESPHPFTRKFVKWLQNEAASGAEAH